MIRFLIGWRLWRQVRRIIPGPYLPEEINAAGSQFAQVIARATDIGVH